MRRTRGLAAAGFRSQRLTEKNPKPFFRVNCLTILLLYLPQTALAFSIFENFDIFMPSPSTHVKSLP